MNAVLRTTLAQINPIVGDLRGNVARILNWYFVVIRLKIWF